MGPAGGATAHRLLREHLIPSLRPTERPWMRPIAGIGVGPQRWQLGAPAAAELLPAAPAGPGDGDELAALLDSLAQPRGSDGESGTDPQLLRYFTSHVDAACFIALLQMQDPLPRDERLRPEYRRHYRDLHESLETPVLSVDALGFGAADDG